MKHIKIEEITIPEERHRKKFDENKLIELAESIRNVGLIHPPVLRQEDGRYILVSGERRLRAMKTLHQSNTPFTHCGEPVPSGMIPYEDFGNLDEKTALEIELEENIVRQDLSWQERAAATARLHSLRKEQNPKQTFSDTAEEIYGTPASVSQVKMRTILAEYLSDPDIASASTEKAARNILYNKIEKSLMSELYRRKEDSEESLDHVIECKDAISALRGLPSKMFDVILTDPPYGIDVKQIENVTINSINLQHEYDDDWDNLKQTLTEFSIESFRVAKEQAHLYMFCDVKRFVTLYEIFTSAGWWVWTRPLIWFKDTGVLFNPYYGPRRMYECILYAIKGYKPTTGVYSDVISTPAVKNKVYAAEKPVALLDNLLARSVAVGDYILDPFCGSGSTLIAGHNRKCIVYCYDIEPACITITKEKLKELIG